MIRPAQKRPSWLKVKLPAGAEYRRVKGIVESHKLETVCAEARCPNIGECWKAGTATFMILGDTCTRACGFCAVKTGRPDAVDADEPRRVGQAVASMGLRHAVITAVDRDDLPDSGAAIFAATVHEIRRQIPGCGVELLIGDCNGNRDALKVIYDSKPDILAHNIETVKSRHDPVRRQADYQQSLNVIRYAHDCGLVTKSGMMLGIGETDGEIVEALRDLRAHDCDNLTLGQYLQPTRRHLPVERFVTPEQFAQFKQVAYELGFKYVESGPLVRSSYHAERATSRTDETRQAPSS